MKRLFIIGNGFDLEHSLPTNYKKNFKLIAQKNEQIEYFWDIYQTYSADIWDDFENNLAHPNFNTLEDIFKGYSPDFYSDYESDRNAIITQVDLNGNLVKSLYEFANEAESKVKHAGILTKYSSLFKPHDLFISFNYTHTLEKLYTIDEKQVLHIHGEVGKDNLLLGYPDGEFKPEKYIYDPRRKGRGPYVEVDIQKYINDIAIDMDYYTLTAYQMLINKTKSFYKPIEINKLQQFLVEKEVDEIIVMGHSCKIDFSYFEYLNKLFPSAKWIFHPFDSETEQNVKKMISKVDIKNYQIN